MIARTGAIFRKEFIHIFRDWRTLVVVLLLPVVMLVIYGYGVNLDVRDIAMAVCDRDGTPESRALICAFEATGYFHVRRYLGAEREAGELLDRGVVQVALFIPRGYGERRVRGRAADVQLIVDGSDSATASAIIGYADTLLRFYSARATVAALARRGVPRAGGFVPLDPRVRVLYNPDLKSTYFIVPGLIAVILMLLSALLTAMTVVREREQGTIEQLVVSPLRPGELMLGKLLPYVVIAYVDVVLVLAAGRILFGVPVRGSVALLLALAGIYLFSALGLGLLISVSAKTQRVAMTVALIATMLPTVLLSGFIFPIRSMPRVLQPLTDLLPAKHFLIIIRSVLLKGVGLEVVWPQAAILALFGVVLIGLSALCFKKRL